LNKSLNQLELNEKFFKKALSKAQIALRNGELNSVIAWAQIAADFAWARHPGFYTSVELESLLLEVAHRLGEHVDVIAASRFIKSKCGFKNKIHVLHVLTEAYEVGGHTRVVMEWIRNTLDIAVNSIVTTSQSEQFQFPRDLISLVEASGGWQVSLIDYSSNLIARSHLLRHLSKNWADVVVLHVHPYDALPIVAFGIDEGPPIILFNHADHVFWLGSSLADIVADLRPVGQKLSSGRRGLVNSRILPIPISKVTQSPYREAIRRKLNIEPTSIVLLTVGQEYKYTKFAGYDFFSTMTKILKKYPHTVLIAAGPQPNGKWMQSSTILPNRIRMTGRINRSELQTFYDCADIYIDGFPMGGITAMLEAGIQGLPIIGLNGQTSRTINGSDDISLASFGTHAPSIEAFTSLLENMIASQSVRFQKTTQIKESIEATHLPPGWNKYLNDILLSLPSKHTTRLPTHIGLKDDTDLFLADFKAAVLSNENPQQTFNKRLIHQAKYLRKNEQIWNFPKAVL
jgi:hypothetical protein